MLPVIRRQRRHDVFYLRSINVDGAVSTSTTTDTHLLLFGNTHTIFNYKLCASYDSHTRAHAQTPSQAVAVRACEKSFSELTFRVFICKYPVCELSAYVYVLQLCECVVAVMRPIVVGVEVVRFTSISRLRMRRLSRTRRPNIAYAAYYARIGCTKLSVEPHNGVPASLNCRWFCSS